MNIRGRGADSRTMQNPASRNHSRSGKRGLFPIGGAEDAF